MADGWEPQFWDMGWEPSFYDMGWQRNDQTFTTCFSCGEAGHIARRCPNFKDTRTCYNCGEEGHISRFCTNRRRSKQDCFRYEDEIKNIGDRYFQEKSYEEAVRCYTQEIIYCSVYYGSRSACYMMLNKLPEALKDAMESVRLDPNFVRGYLLVGKCSMELGDPTAAIMSYRKVLQLEPDNKDAKDGLQQAESQHKTTRLLVMKEEGNREFLAGNLEKAYAIYTEALGIDPDNKLINAELFCNRGTVCTMIGKKKKAIADFTRAIELDTSYLEAYLLRAKSYMGMKKYEEAVQDYEKVFQMENSLENKRLLQEAKSALVKSKMKDYYKILGVSRNASDDEIRKAYKKQALAHHPDRHSHCTVEVQKEEESKFKEMGEAYAVLSNQRKRKRYNRDYDLVHLR